MAYKIKFYNTRTREEYFDEVEYRTYNEAMLVAENIGHDFLSKDVRILGIEEVGETPIPDTPDSIDENKKEPVYDLTDDGKGKKYDSGKSMVGTLCRVFPRALLGIGQCIRFGQSKYPNPKNWSLVEDGLNRYTDSLMRHLLKMFAGQDIDPETKLPHIFHVCWNALAISEFYIKEHTELEEVLFK